MLSGRPLKKKRRGAHTGAVIMSSSNNKVASVCTDKGAAAEDIQHLLSPFVHDEDCEVDTEDSIDTAGSGHRLSTPPGIMLRWVCRCFLA